MGAMTGTRGGRGTAAAIGTAAAMAMGVWVMGLCGVGRMAEAIVVAVAAGTADIEDNDAAAAV
jgi:hypothetical protein